MTDQSGRDQGALPGGGDSGDPRERSLPVPRPAMDVAPADRFSAPPSAHASSLSPERAATIVRQSASARWVGFLAVLVVAIFVIAYYFYDLGVPGIAGTSRLTAEVTAQQVTAVERGYNIFQANCARCHGANGEGGIGPVLNDQSKLYVHLKVEYLRNVLFSGGRYVCGNAKSLMPVWDLANRGPLNYVEIEDLIAYLRATNQKTYTARDPATREPLTDATGKVKTFTGWRDPAYKPDPGATPVPDCWTDAFKTAAPSAGPSGSGGGTAVVITAVNLAFDSKAVETLAGQAFTINFDNQDAGIPHNVDIMDAAGASVFKGEIFPGVATKAYAVPALTAGAYKFICDVHPTMTGTLTVK